MSETYKKYDGFLRGENNECSGVYSWDESVTAVLSSLEHAGRAPQLPLAITLPCGELVIEQWLRVLPAKRYVARARVGNDTRLVKLFVGSRAEKKAREEAAAIERLVSAGVPTPALIDVGAISGNAAWLFIEYFEDCETLSSKATLDLSALPEADRACDAGKDAARALAKLHNRNLIHRDIHPGNVLFYQQQCWIIDAVEIVAEAEAKEKETNLGLFLAQLPQNWRHALVLSYNAVSEAPVDYDTVCDLARYWQGKRAEDLSEKSVRDCSLFQVHQSVDDFSAVWRDQADWLMPLLGNLDEVLASAVILKDGASATVGLIEVEGRRVVIKRYNIKSFWHGLKRFWRPTRAWISWQAGIRLRVLGIHTPKPLALKEERLGPFRKRGYLLVEASDGQDLFDLLSDESMSQSGQNVEELLPCVAQEIEQLLVTMEWYHISHGDFKATNLLWEGRLCVIDLDSICWHAKRATWKKAFAKDKARLLRNWSSDSRPYQYLKNLLTP